MEQRFWKRAGSLAVLAAAAVIGTAAPDADARKPVVVKRFLLGRLEPNTNKFIATGARGTTNAMRDNVIMFVFTAAVDITSVNARTVKIGIPASTNLFIDAPGTFSYYEIKRWDSVANDWIRKKLYLSRILFDPTSRNAEQTKQDPYGFAENATYTVTVPGTDADTVKVVKGINGVLCSRTFTTTFGTQDRFLQDYIQPSIVTVVGSDLPLVSLEQRSNVDSRADVIAYFSEPMLPQAFDSTTFNVYNLTQNREVRGTYRASADGKAFTFRPSIGYGKGPSDVEVTITTALLDRSQNPLNRGITFRFQSEPDPFAPETNDIIEEFDDPNKVQCDLTFTLSNPEYGRAVWNFPGSPPAAGIQTGMLTGAFGSGTKEVNFGYNGFFGSPPMWLYSSHTQMLYTNSQMSNTARTITGYSLLLDSGWTLAAGTYVGTSVLMGHNVTQSLNTNFTSSFSDTPVTTVNNVNYAVNSSMVTSGFVRGPTYTVNWPYNGIDHVVLDVNVTGANNVYNRCARGNTGNAGIDYHFVAGGAGGGTASFSGQNLSARFTYLVDKCEGRSNWYDVQDVDPTAVGTSFLDPIVFEVQPAGTSIGVSYQGTNDPLDTFSFSAWTTDPQTTLTGYRYIRFHVDMTLNISTNAKPSISRLVLPFIWF